MSNTLIGGIGNDRFATHRASDTLYGGGGIDVLSLDVARSAAIVQLVAADPSDGLGAEWRITAADGSFSEEIHGIQRALFSDGTELLLSADAAPGVVLTNIGGTGTGTGAATGTESTAKAGTAYCISAARLAMSEADAGTGAFLAAGATITSVSALADGSTHGTVTLAQGGSGAVLFTADVGYHGEAKFAYTLANTDGSTVSAVAELSVAAAPLVQTVAAAAFAASPLRAFAGVTETLALGDPSALFSDPNDGGTLSYSVTDAFGNPVPWASLAQDGTLSLTAPAAPDSASAANGFTAPLFLTATDPLGGSTSIALSVDVQAQPIAGVLSAVGGNNLLHADSTTVSVQALAADGSALDAAAAATNTIQTSASFSLASQSVGAEALSIVARADGSTGGITITGDAAGDVLSDLTAAGSPVPGVGSSGSPVTSPSPFAANTLAGGAGDDTFDPHAASDILIGGGGFDTVRIDAAQSDCAISCVDANPADGAGQKWIVAAKDGSFSEELHGISEAVFSDGGSFQLALPSLQGGAVADSIGNVLGVKAGQTLAMTADELSGHAWDPNFNPISVTGVAAMADGSTHGTVALNPDGAVAFHADAGYTGTASFSVTIDDGYGPQTVVDTVQVALPPTVLAPAGTVLAGSVSDAAPGDSGTVLALPDLAALFAEPNAGSSLSYSLTDAQGNPVPWASLSIDPSTGAATILSSPAPGAEGIHDLLLTASDPIGGSASVNLRLTVSPQADDPSRPLVSAESGSWRNVGGAMAYQGSLTAHSPTGAGAPAFAEIADAFGNTGPAHGTLALAADGSFTYTPDAGWTGGDSFAIGIASPAAADGSGGAMAVREIHVQPLPPTGPWDRNIDGLAGVPVQGLLDPSGATLSADGLSASGPVECSISAAPEHGTLVLTPDGAYAYTADPGFSGADAFAWTAVDSLGRMAVHTVGVRDLPPQETLSVQGGGIGARDGLVSIAASTIPYLAIDGSQGGNGDLGAWLGFSTQTDPTGTHTHYDARLEIRSSWGSDDFLYSYWGGATTAATAQEAALEGASGWISSDGIVHGTVVLTLGVGASEGGEGFSSCRWWAQDTTQGAAAQGYATFVLHDGFSIDNGTWTHWSGAQLGNWNWAENLPWEPGAWISATPASALLPAAGAPHVFAVAGNGYAPGSVSGSTPGSLWTGGTGDDVFAVAGGTSTLVGGGGSDELLLHGSAADYSLSRHFDAQGKADGVEIAGPWGTDVVARGIDRAVFSDGTAVSLAGTPTVSDSTLSAASGLAAVGRLGAFDPNGNVLSYSLAANPGDPSGPGGPAHGTVAFNADGSYVYTAQAGYTGSDAFSVSVSDGDGHSSIAHVSIDVSAAIEAWSDRPSCGLVGAGLSNVRLVPTSASPSGSGSLNASIQLTPDGFYRIQEGAAATGTETFSWTGTDASGNAVSGTRTVVEHASQAVLDAGAGSSWMTPLAGLSASASSIDLHAVDALDGVFGNFGGGAWLGTWQDAQGVLHFRLDVRPDASTNSRLFSITGSTAPGAIPDGSSSVSGPLSVVLSAGGDPACPTVTGFFSDQGWADPTPDLLASLRLVLAVPAGWTPPTGGRIGSAGADGLIWSSGGTYWSPIGTTTAGNVPDPFDPNAGNLRVAQAGGATLAGGTGNDTLVANGGHDVLVGGGGTDTAFLSGAESDWTFSVDADSSGNPAGTGWTATKTDGSSAVSTVHLSAIDHAAFSDGTTRQLAFAPVVHDAVLSAAPGLSVHGAVSASDPNGNALSYTLSANADGTTGPSHGTLSFNADGTYAYAAQSGYVGADAFSVAVSDGDGHSSISRVSVDVSAPIAVLDGTPACGQVGAGLGLSGIHLVSGARNAAVQLTADGYFRVVADATASGGDAFTWSGTDAAGRTVGGTTFLSETQAVVETLTPNAAAGFSGLSVAATTGPSLYALDRLDGNADLPAAGEWIHATIDGAGAMHLYYGLRAGATNDIVYDLVGRSADGLFTNGVANTTATLTLTPGPTPWQPWATTGYWSDTGVANPLTAQQTAAMGATFTVQAGWNASSINGQWLQVPVAGTPAASAGTPSGLLVAAAGSDTLVGGSGDDTFAANPGTGPGRSFSGVFVGNGGSDAAVLHGTLAGTTFSLDASKSGWLVSTDAGESVDLQGISTLVLHDPDAAAGSQGGGGTAALAVLSGTDGSLSASSAQGAPPLCADLRGQAVSTQFGDVLSFALDGAVDGAVRSSLGTASIACDGFLRFDAASGASGTLDLGWTATDSNGLVLHKTERIVFGPSGYVDTPSNVFVAPLGGGTVSGGDGDCTLVGNGGSIVMQAAASGATNFDVHGGETVEIHGFDLSFTPKASTLVLAGGIQPGGLSMAASADGVHLLSGGADMVAFEGTTLASFGGATSGAQALQWMTANHKLNLS